MADKKNCWKIEMKMKIQFENGNKSPYENWKKRPRK